MFENYEIAMFAKQAEEIEKAKNQKIKEMFEVQEKLNRIKVEFIFLILLI